MKKILLIIFFNFFLFSNAFSKNLILECTYPSGNKLSTPLTIDFSKKKVDQYPFEKGSTNKIIKFISTNKASGSFYNLMFYTINLENNTLEIIRRDNVDLRSKEIRDTLKDEDFFKLVQSSNPRITLKCTQNSTMPNYADFKKGDRYICDEPTNTYKLNLQIIKKIPSKNYDPNIIVREIWNISGQEIISDYLAVGYNENLGYYYYDELEKELSYMNLYPPDELKTNELRITMFKLDNPDDLVLKNILSNRSVRLSNSKNTNTDSINFSVKEINNEIFFFNSQNKVHRKYTVNQQTIEKKLINISQYFCSKE